MIAHRLNARGAIVSHGLNPIPPGVFLPLTGRVVELNIDGEIDRLLAPRVQVDALEDVEGGVRLDVAIDVTGDLAEDATGAFDVREGIKVQG